MGGEGQFLDFVRGHNCYEGGHIAHGGPPVPPTIDVTVHLDHSLFLEKSEVHSGRQKVERKEETKTLCDHLGQKNILNSLKKSLCKII